MNPSRSDICLCLKDAVKAFPSSSSISLLSIRPSTTAKIKLDLLPNGSSQSSSPEFVARIRQSPPLPRPEQPNEWASNIDNLILGLESIGE